MNEHDATIQRYLSGDLSNEDMRAFEQRLASERTLQTAADRQLSRKLLTPPDVSEDDLHAYVDGTATPEERQRVDLALTRDPAIKAHLRELFSLRVELDEFVLEEPKRAKAGFWARVAAAVSLPATATSPSLSFAPDDASLDDWRRIAFPPEASASGVVRFEDGFAVVSLQSERWTPGMVIRAEVRGGRTGEVHHAVGVVEDDAIPSAEFVVEIDDEQPVEVAFSPVELTEFDDEAKEAILASFRLANQLESRLADGWREWAAAALEDTAMEPKSTARALLDAA